MPCGCQSACGCNVTGGSGISVQRIGDTFEVSVSGNASVETFDASGSIAASTDIVIFDGDPASTLELAPAIAGRSLEVWNRDAADDVDVDAALGETVNGGAGVTVGALEVGKFISIVDGEWLAHVH